MWFWILSWFNFFPEWCGVLLWWTMWVYNYLRILLITLYFANANILWFHFIFAAHAVVRKWVLLTDPDDKMAGVKVGKEDQKVLFFYPIQIMTRRLLLYSLNKKMWCLSQRCEVPLTVVHGFNIFDHYMSSFQQWYCYSNNYGDHTRHW